MACTARLVSLTCVALHFIKQRSLFNLTRCNVVHSADAMVCTAWLVNLTCKALHFIKQRILFNPTCNIVHFSRGHGKQFKLPVIVMPTFFHTLDATTPQSQADKQHTVHFSRFSCCLNVVLSLDKGVYPENSHAMWCQ